MISRALFPYIVATIVATTFAYHPHARVYAFSIHAPVTTSRGGRVSLQGTIAMPTPENLVALYATKKNDSANEEKSTTTNKSATKKKTKEAASSEDEEDNNDEAVKLKKADIVATLAEKTGMTKTQSDLVLTAVLNVIATEVANGKRLSLPGFGTFKLNFRPARKGRNPASGEEIDIRAAYAPSFSASKTFKDMCNPDR